MPRRDSAKARAGRRTVLTDRRADVICQAVRTGAHITEACDLAGVGQSTLYSWLQRAEDTEVAINTGQPYPAEHVAFLEFRDRLVLARAQRSEFLVKSMNADIEGGRITSEEPIVDNEGRVQYDQNGEPLFKRTFTSPNGRLALAVAARTSPDRWGEKQRIEILTPAGTVNPDMMPGGPEPDAEAAETGMVESVTTLAARMALTARQRAEGFDAPEEPDDIVDAEVVEDQ